MRAIRNTAVHTPRTDLSKNRALRTQPLRTPVRAELAGARDLFGARRTPSAHPADGFEPAGGREAAAKQKVQAHFRAEFGDLAQDKAKFHDTMKKVYGQGYDKGKAEQFRQQALKGDFSWMPKMQFLDSASLKGAHGAYDAASETVFLSKDLLSDPGKAAQTYMEEAGHHLDTKLNKNDTKGDEGEMFRRVMSGENLSQKQIDEIRNEDDKGTITVDGKEIEVEFWNPFKAAKKAVKKVGGAVKKAAKAVGDGVKKVAQGAGQAAASVAKGVGGALVDVTRGAANGILGFGKNLIQGNVAGAGKALIRGLDKAFLQAPARLGKTLLDGAGQLIGGVAGALGPVGKPLKWIADKGIDVAKTAIDTTSGVMRDLWRLGPETVIGLGEDLWSSAKKLAQGDVKGGFQDLGRAFGNAGKRFVGGFVDMGVRVVGGIASAGSSLLGFEKDMTKTAMTEDVKADLEAVYGDSVNLDEVRIKRGGLVSAGAPRTVGNTIYMPETWNGQPNFNPDGTLTDSGKKLLMHEMVHVWQNQNGGGDFWHESLYEQTKGAMSGGDRGHAYDWQEAAASGKPFEQLNPEQQGAVIETANWIMSSGQPLRPGTGLTYFDPESQRDVTLSADEVDYLRSAMAKVRAGIAD